MFVKGILKCLVDFTENYGAKLCKLAEMLGFVSRYLMRNYFKEPIANS